MVPILWLAADFIWSRVEGWRNWQFPYARVQKSWVIQLDSGLSSCWKAWCSPAPSEKRNSLNFRPRKYSKMKVHNSRTFNLAPVYSMQSWLRKIAKVIVRQATWIACPPSEYSTQSTERRCSMGTSWPASVPCSSDPSSCPFRSSLSSSWRTGPTSHAWTR